MRTAGFPLTSREMLHLIEDAGQAGLWAWDLQANHLRWSMGLFRMLGFDPSTQPTFELYQSLVHPDDRLKLDDPFHLVREGVLKYRELRIIQPNGTLRWLASRGQVLHGPDGKANHFVGVVTDITDRKQAEEKLSGYVAAMSSLDGLLGIHTWQVGQNSIALGPPELMMSFSHDEANHWRANLSERERNEAQRQWDESVARESSYHMQYNGAGTADRNTMVCKGVAVRDGANRPAGWVGFLAAAREGLIPKPAETALEVSAGQVRAARAILGWSGAKLAKKCGVSFSTIRRLEEGHGLRKAHVASIRRALESAGISFSSTADGTESVTFRAPTRSNRLGLSDDAPPAKDKGLVKN